MRSASLAALLALAPSALAQERLHFTYLWHLEQPIYWPARQASGPDRYERAWESIQRKDAGAAHPQDDLRGIFGLADRQAVYQYRVKDSISAISAAPEAGAQITYSGGLFENISSLGAASQLGYSPGWANDLRTARSWTTASGAAKPRLDILLFSFHHALLPLLDDAAIRKEIQLYKRLYADAWGAAVPLSGGFFPSEMAFSPRLIPILASEGVRWTIVSSEKLSRACPDFPVVFGSGGINCDPPNRADQLNPAAGAFYRQSISRGCAPAEAVPLAYTPHRMRYTDPATGATSEIIVVPASQHMGWKDGYAPLGLSDFNAVDALARPQRPMLVVLAHDGDNAWGGGFSYYMEATPNLVSSARNAGYIPTVIERYLADHPVPANDYIHVEQGAWVNADGDFGSPQFLNWNWPLLNSSGQIDIPGGWHEDERNWAVITAATARVDTAEQIWRDQGGAVDPGKIVYPETGANNVERAWHYFLGGLNSGFMYYGTALDMEVKPTVACNQAVALASPVIGDGSLDRTPPTIWEPQRHPWNPGSTNFGPHLGYRTVQSNGDFWIWTFVADASPLASVSLKYRLDADGSRALVSPDNDTYAGGPAVGPWQSLPMTRRPFPAGNIYNNPGIDFFVTPTLIADEYSIQLTGLRSCLVDYYIEAVDSRGNTRRSAIQHVSIGDGSGGGGGGGAVVTLAPTVPVAGQALTITYDPVGRSLANAAQVSMHHGYNNWNPVLADLPMTRSAQNKWQATITVPSYATQFDCVFNNGPGPTVWDNNSGQDWHFAVTGGGGGGPTWTMDGVRDTDSLLIAQNPSGIHLWAGLKGDVLYVATEDAGEGNDHFILLSQDAAQPLQPAMWAKSGQVARWDAFLADENNNDFEGWFDAAPGTATQAATAANGGVLEGTINLRQELLAGNPGPLPDHIRLAVALYATADAGQLLRTHQVPPSVNNDFNIDAAEYLRVRLCDITPGSPSCCPADFNADGFLDFFDLDAFIECFEGAACPPGRDADFNADGFTDFFDSDAFIAAFEAGC